MHHAATAGTSPASWPCRFDPGRLPPTTNGTVTPASHRQALLPFPDCQDNCRSYPACSRSNASTSLTPEDPRRGRHAGHFAAQAAFAVPLGRSPLSRTPWSHRWPSMWFGRFPPGCSSRPSRSAQRPFARERPCNPVSSTDPPLQRSHVRMLGSEFYAGQVAVLVSVITCPACATTAQERMPQDACQYFYGCAGCGEMLKPRDGDCCVFCSYADTPCPPKKGES